MDSDHLHTNKLRDGGPTKPVAFSEGWLLLFFLVIAAVVVFWLPWFVPLQSAVKSESYSLGFNNRIAVFGLVACIVLHGICLLLRARPHCRSANCLEWLSLKKSLHVHQRGARLGVAVLVFVTLAQLCFLFWWNHVVRSPYWSESGYFLSRIDLLALGFTPYRDFQFLYGPALLYGPLLVDRLSLGWLGLEDSYAVCIGISYVIGNICFYVFLRGLRLSDRLFTVALACGLLLFSPVTMGLNYTPLRFALVPSLLVLLSTCELSWLKKPSRWWSLAVLSFCFVLAALVVSPEMGVAMIVGILGYCSMLVLRGDRYSALCLVAGVACSAGLFYGAVPAEYFSGIFTFKAGGNNFPIYPNIHNLVFLFSVQFVFPLLGSSAFVKTEDMRSALAIALCCAGGILMFPALGRCDPGHVFLNSLIPLFIMFAAGHALGSSYARAWSIIMGLCLAISLASYWSHYRHLFVGSLAERLEWQSQESSIKAITDQWGRLRAKSENGDELNWRKHVPIQEGAVELFNEQDIVLFGAFDLAIDRLTKLKLGYRPHYHVMPTPEIYSDEDVERAANDLLKHAVILVPASLVDSVNAGIDRNAYEKNISTFLSGLMVFPVVAQLRNDPYIPELEVLQRLLNGCVVETTSIEGLVALRPPQQIFTE